MIRHFNQRQRPGIDLHVLPSGNPLAFDDRRQLRWRDTTSTAELADGAYVASQAYLAGLGAG